MIKKFLIGTVAVILALMAGVFLFAKDFDVIVSEADAQAAIDEYVLRDLPDNWGVSFSPKYMTIDFKDNNTALIAGRVDIEGFAYEGEFDGKFATGVNYKHPRLYLDNLDLVDGGFSTDEETQSELSDLKKVAGDFLKRQRESRGIDPSKNESVPSHEQALDDLILKSTKAFFESIPIYNLNNAGPYGSAVSLALRDVTFTEDSAIVTLSPVTALLRILAMIGFVALVVIQLFGRFIFDYWLSRAMSSDKEK